MKKKYTYLLDIVYVLAALVCLYLTFKSESPDIYSIIINAALFVIVFLIFFHAKKAMKNIVAITQDLKMLLRRLQLILNRKRNISGKNIIAKMARHCFKIVI